MIGAYLVYKYWPTMKRILAVLAVAITILTGGYFYARGPEIRQIEKIIEVPRAKENLDELLSEVPRAYGIPEVIARGIVKQESNGNMEAIRFEPGQMSRAAKFTKNVEQQRMLASSHCALQVMGWHSASLGIKWVDLYDPRTCVEAGMKILSDCLNRGKELNKYDKYFNALHKGQFSTGRNRLSKETGIHRSTVDRILETLESEHQIEQQKNNTPF
jgi:soluble lytic murein transglycosylase-like protein